MHVDEIDQDFTSNFCAEFPFVKKIKSQLLVKLSCAKQFHAKKSAHKMLLKLTTSKLQESCAVIINQRK